MGNGVGAFTKKTPRAGSSLYHVRFERKDHLKGAGF